MKRGVDLSAAMSVLFAAQPRLAWAHHSFAMFDMTKPHHHRRGEGFPMVEPHSWLYVLGSEPGKPPATWEPGGAQPQYADPQGLASTDLKIGR